MLLAETSQKYACVCRTIKDLFLNYFKRAVKQYLYFHA